MTAALENVLAKAGLKVDTAEFLALVEEAARRLSPPNPQPAHYFSPEQRAVLTDAGLDLSPHRDEEIDYRAGAVATHAVFADSALTVGEAARRLGVDDSRVRHRLKERRLTGWKDQGGWRLPAWQFTATGVLPGLDAVLRAVPDDQPALVVAGFMSTPQDDLRIDDAPVTPREWLLAGGDPTPVAELASTLGTPA
ncbi:DNA-binding protein [Prauserella oleivorans]|uniref:DNA-binding protein n=1 Tax=Prauserella oleivorans TaxID=1478153 RepID=A0ABW5WF35_9PSEU